MNLRNFLIGTVLSSLSLLSSNLESEAKDGNTAGKKRALIVVTSHKQLGDSGKSTGYYLPEVAHPYLVLKDNGFKIDVASPAGGEAPMDPKSKDLKDPQNKKFMDDKSCANSLKNTLKLSGIKPDNYSVIMFAGGHGTMWDFPDDKDMQRLSKKIYENGGIVAAVCHGPAALVNLKLSNGKYLVSGKKVSTFTNEEESEMKLDKTVPFLLESKLKERGATIEKVPNWKPKVVVSERLITGQNPASAEGVGKAIAGAVK